MTAILASLGATFERLQSSERLKNPYFLLAAAGAFAGSYYVLIRRRKKLQRSWSFTSVGMLLGAFPEKADVPEAIINTALYMDDCPSTEDLVAQVVEPLLVYERMATVPDPKIMASRPCPIPLDAHKLVRRIEIRGDDELTDQTIMSHASDPFSHRTDLPWWEILVIENHGVGLSACVIRIHHCLADGMSLISAFEKILKNKDGKETGSLVSKAMLRRQSSMRKTNIFTVLWSLVEATIHVLALGATKYDDATLFSKANNSKMTFSGKRSFVAFPVVPLDFVKELKNAANVTVNDIIMTAISQSIHDYCEDRNCPILAAKRSKTQCRSLIPASLPRAPQELHDTQKALRNTWCMVSAEMSIGHDDIMDRLAKIHVSTQELKSKPRALVQLKIQNAIPPFLPKSIARQTVFDVFSRHSLVFTNIPGPDHVCLFAGKEAKAVQMFFPNILPQVSVMSYAGQVYGNIVYDPDELDIASFHQYYARALKELANRLGVKVPPSLEKYDN